MATEAELWAAVGEGGAETVTVRAGARIQLTGGPLKIARSVRLVGAAGDGGLPAIVGAAGEHALGISGGGVAVGLEGLRIEASGGGNAIDCWGAASLAARRCELAGGRAHFQDKGTAGELTDCTIEGSEGFGLYVSRGATVAVEGGAIRGCARTGVLVVHSGSRATVR